MVFLFRLTISSLKDEKDASRLVRVSSDEDNNRYRVAQSMKMATMWDAVDSSWSEALHVLVDITGVDNKSLSCRSPSICQGV